MKKLLFVFSLAVFLFGCASPEPDAIYVDANRGDDRYPGTRLRPVKTLTEVNLRLSANPLNIYFSAGQAFEGTLYLNDIHGTSSDPIRISSRGRKRAIINGEDSAAIIIEDCSNIMISAIKLKGSGRKDGNTTNGLSLVRTTDTRVIYTRAEGFQKSGVDLHDCRNILLKNVTAINNGFSGINVMGSNRESSRNITIKDCSAENNAGDPTRLDNHSGNGILVGVSDSVTIERCTATNNGWDMPREGNGPVGIWAWESSHVSIQYCVSYGNKTSENGKDGGGFDLDGGVRKSIIQYCISFDNEGAGYGLFQYAGASPWSGNVVRNCISINDAHTTAGSGSVFIWNGSEDKNQLSDCTIKNNLIVNFKAPLISFEADSEHENFDFTGNLFIGRDTISGRNTGSRFLRNIWLGEGR